MELLGVLAVFEFFFLEERDKALNFQAILIFSV